MRSSKLALIVALLVGVTALPFVVRSMTRPAAQVSMAAEEGKGKSETGRGKRGDRPVAVEAAIARGATTTTDIRAIIPTVYSFLGQVHGAKEEPAAPSPAPAPAE